MSNQKQKYGFVMLLVIAVMAAAMWAAMAPVGAQNGAAGSNGQSLPEVIEAIEKARVTTRILYVTAHPDDEPGAVLAYLARGLHADVALLSLTRGEGGQNALGPEQAPQLGVVRTAELEAATRIYGVRLFFTRAPDFGYSKSPEETIKIWGDAVEQDILQVINTFRPDIIINHWAGVRTGHGQHQSTGMLIEKLFELAEHPQAAKERRHDLEWIELAARLLRLSRTESAGGWQIPSTEISPIWGKNYAEIGGEGFAKHRTQGVAGFLGSPFFLRKLYLVAADGRPLDLAALARPLPKTVQDHPYYRETPEAADRLLAAAREAALRLDWAATARALAASARKIDEAIRNYDEGMPLGTWEGRETWQLEQAKERINTALAMTAALEISGRADRSEIVAGESFTVRVDVQRRADVLPQIEKPTLVLLPGWSIAKEEASDTGIRFTVAVPKDAKVLSGPGDWMHPWPAALVKAKLKSKVEGYEFETETEVTATRVTSVSAETRPLLLAPAVTLTVEPKTLVVVSSGARRVNEPGGNIAGTDSKIENRKSKIGGERIAGAQQAAPLQNGGIGEREIVVRVRHYATSAEKITVGIDVPAGWMVSPNGGTEEQKDEKTKIEKRKAKIGGQADPEASGLSHKEQAVEFAGAGDQLVRFTVKLPTKIAAGKYELKAYAKRALHQPAQGGAAQAGAQEEEFRMSLEPLVTLPTRMWSEPSIARVQVMDVTVPKDLRVGYVTAENDLIPQALREIGVRVELLDEAMLAFGDLSKYDAIAIGIRAYELRSDLARANPRLLEYAAAGGTLVVQYQREGVWNAMKPAPYAATIGNGLRTTDENSPVRILEPSHAVLNFPNAMRIEDYSGWVQERGLYYWGTFDAKYTPVLAMKDPGEQEALGALVYARHGKGVYIYTGLSFFRQLPEGVPGAYRLFVNLLSQGKKK